MLLRQLFNHACYSYTYLVADPLVQEAVLIDPIKSKLRDYVQLFSELGYTITAAIDTHSHDDRVSGLSVLRDLWGCETIRGAPCSDSSITRVIEDGDIIKVGRIKFKLREVKIGVCTKR